MTVNELIERLQEFQMQGKGEYIVLDDFNFNPIPTAFENLDDLEYIEELKKETNSPGFIFIEMER